MSRYWVLALVCVLLSVAGPIYAVCWGEAADGGRGGALAVAATFLTLILGRGTAKGLLQKPLPTEFQGQRIPVSDETLKTYLAEQATEGAKDRNTLAILLDSQDKQRWPLVVASGIGTFFWGFGDVVAVWLGAT